MLGGILDTTCNFSAAFLKMLCDRNVKLLSKKKKRKKKKVFHKRSY